MTSTENGMCLNWHLPHSTKSCEAGTPFTCSRVCKLVCVRTCVRTCMRACVLYLPPPDRKTVLIRCHTWLSIQHLTLPGSTRWPEAAGVRGAGGGDSATQQRKRGVELVRHAWPHLPRS